MATAAKTRPRREVKNTYKLPEGDRLRLALRGWFREQRAAVMAYYRTGVVERKDDGEGGGLWDLPDWDAFELGDLEMSRRMAPHITAIFDAEGERFTAHLGLDPDSWSVTNPHLADVIDELALDLSESTNATTSREIGDAIRATRETLHEGLVTRGESIATLTKRIRAIFDAAETYRARRIAQTEANRAAHAAQEQSAIESEVVTGWKWLASSDACPMCLTIARRCKFVRLGQPFAVVGDHPAYSVIRHPPAHVNCRCSMVEVLDIDDQPEWGTTLIQPEPEQEDVDKAEEYAGTHGTKPKPPKPKPAPRPKPAPKRKPAPKPAPLPEPQPAPEPQPVPKPSKPRPAGPPVSDALTVQIKDAPTKRAADDVLGQIGKIHGTGGLPQIPLKEVKKLPSLGRFSIGEYTGRPLDIQIKPFGDNRRDTIAHEIGHFLEHSGIPRMPGSDPSKPRDFANDPRFAEWHKAMSESEAVKKLKALEGKGAVEYTKPDGTIGTYPLDKRHSKYLAEDGEIWARAYAQYVATRGGSPDMKADLENMRATRQNQIYGTNWSDEDFKPIGAAIDGIFKGMGWIQ